MYILGIETSCDETSAAVVMDGTHLLSNIVVSSLKEHAKYGGIIPEIASRRQLECISAVVDTALTKAGITRTQIDAIAVTTSPGLIGSLLVGISFARAMSYALTVPLIEIDHIKAHLYAPFLVDKKGQTTDCTPQLPAIGLVVSGGHTSLYHMKDPVHARLLGSTRDDAVGEAFDKVARILNLGYPGGPAIDKMARKGRPGAVSFTCAELPGTLDFSFSGIKTAVLYHTRKQGHATPQAIADICRAFQDSMIDVIVRKTLAATTKLRVKTIIVGGGVAANSALRESLSYHAARNNSTVHFPSLALCMDNAAMVAGLAFHLFKKSKRIKRSTRC